MKYDRLRGGKNDGMKGRGGSKAAREKRR